MPGNAKTTPKLNKSLEQVKTSSGKKLVQARLPFKLIDADSASSKERRGSEDGSRAKSKDGKVDERHHSRKRKLSYSAGEDGEKSPAEKSKENALQTKKKRTLDGEDIILIDDDDDVAEETGTEKKDNLKNSTTPTAKRRSAGTPRSAGPATRTKKNESKKKGGSVSKLQIKLPFNTGSKRRKSLRKSTAEASDSSDEGTAALTQSSDEETNPQKRPKVEEASKQVKIISLDTDESCQEPPETSTKVSEKDNAEVASKEASKDEPGEVAASKQPSEDDATEAEGEKSLHSETVSDDEEEPSFSGFEESKSKDMDEEIQDQSLAVTDMEADDESDDGKSRSSTDAAAKADLSDRETDKARLPPRLLSEKKLTPKQLKIAEQRRKIREEKERKLQEEKVKKQREKEEKEEVRKREREEKEEQRRKEREEKEEQRRTERDEKERKRLAEIESKNEEKRKRNEAREEELRKKEEDRKRKEQEKEEAEIKKKKAAEAFTKFFVPKTNGGEAECESNPNKENESLEEWRAFRPFQVKGDMKLAPICRRILSDGAKESFDSVFVSDAAEKSLYLAELRSGQIQALKWRRPQPEVTPEDDDVLIIEDDLERAGQAIVEEAHPPTEHLRAKYFLFHENQRPPYYGTWQKKTAVITPRRPLAQDTKYFDYEVDSDLEWEEEEPGESLHGSDDEKDKESEDDEYEVDNEWFVPHGHLSDEELQDEDECGSREAQKAKLQLLQQEFAEEMKKKMEKIKPRLIGCVWQDVNGQKPEQCATIIWEKLNQLAMLYTDPPLVTEPEVPEKPDSTSPHAPVAEKTKPIELSEDLVKDLVRLVHGNRHAKVFLIKEFIAYIEANEESVKRGDVRAPLKNAVRDKIDELAEWQSIDRPQHLIKKKKKSKKMLCWCVDEEAREKLQLQDLTMENKWQYTLTPRYDHENKPKEHGAKDEETNEGNEQDAPKPELPLAPKEIKGGIAKFTKVLTPKEKAAQLIAIEKPAEVVKKRVPLLMSVARGEQICTSAKNALISQFLKKGEKKGSGAPPAEAPIVVSE